MESLIFLVKHSHLMGLLGAIAPQTMITGELTAKGGLVNPKWLRKFSLIVSCFVEGLNLILLLLGKLCVGSHQCSFNLTV